MIINYINSIDKYSYNDYINDRMVTEYTYRGDGEGDFEDHDNDTTVDCLTHYIEHCEEQIKIAKEVLKMKEGLR